MAFTGKRKRHVFHARPTARAHSLRVGAEPFVPSLAVDAALRQQHRSHCLPSTSCSVSRGGPGPLSLPGCALGPLAHQLCSVPCPGRTLSPNREAWVPHVTPIQPRPREGLRGEERSGARLQGLPCWLLADLFPSKDNTQLIHSLPLKPLTSVLCSWHLQGLGGRDTRRWAQSWLFWSWRS